MVLESPELPRRTRSTAETLLWPPRRSCPTGKTVFSRIKPLRHPHSIYIFHRQLSPRAHSAQMQDPRQKISDQTPAEEFWEDSKAVAASFHSSRSLPYKCRPAVLPMHHQRWRIKPIWSVLIKTNLSFQSPFSSLRTSVILVPEQDSNISSLIAL